MSDNPENKLAGKLFLTMIGVMLLFVGGVFEWLMVRSYLNARASRDWPQVEAVVLRSEVEERQIMGSPAEFRFSVLFGYAYQGKDLTSDRLSPRGSKWTRERSAVVGLVGDYPAGSTHAAWVDPDLTDKAILRHDTKAAGYSLWFPALIMLGGGGMIWGAFGRVGRRAAG